MKRKAVLAIMLTLLFIGILSLTFGIIQVEASGTIYIRANGSVEGTTDISTVDNVTYTFTDNIINQSIVVERDNIVIDGAGYTVQGIGSGTGGIGIYLSYRSNVTIKSMEIKAFQQGIYLLYSSNNNISGNSVTNNGHGIFVVGSSSDYNSIYGNNITANIGSGIWVTGSNWNKIYHNNFINNSHQVLVTEFETNYWDDGYPSGGNYWSDHVCAGNPSNGSQPYIMDANNIDHYPFQDPNGWLNILTIYSSPTGVTFTVDGVSHTTPWSRIYSENTSVSLVMPEFHTVGDARYYWNQWSDGNTSRSRIVTMNASVTLTAYYTGPYYELTVTSSPIIGITFAINGTPETTPYTELLLEGSYTLEMPQTHDGYVWSHWLEDGNTNRIKTVTLDTNITLTGVFYHFCDLNQDRVIDIDDVIIPVLAFGSYPSHPKWNPIADLTGDELVDIDDVVLVALHFGEIV